MGDELLNATMFGNKANARAASPRWVAVFNETRSHSALGCA